MVIIEDEECDCDCHEDTSVHHCFPCCQICDICGKRIKLSFFDSHKYRCEKEAEYINQEIERLSNSDKKSKGVVQNESPASCMCEQDCVCEQESEMCEDKPLQDETPYDYKLRLSYHKGFKAGLEKILKSNEIFEFGYRMGTKDSSENIKPLIAKVALLENKIFMIIQKLNKIKGLVKPMLEILEENDE